LARGSETEELLRAERLESKILRSVINLKAANPVPAGLLVCKASVEAGGLRLFDLRPGPVRVCGEPVELLEGRSDRFSVRELFRLEAGAAGRLPWVGGDDGGVRERRFGELISSAFGSFSGAPSSTSSLGGPGPCEGSKAVRAGSESSNGAVGGGCSSSWAKAIPSSAEGKLRGLKSITAPARRKPTEVRSTALIGLGRWAR